MYDFILFRVIGKAEYLCSIKGTILMRVRRLIPLVLVSCLAVALSSCIWNDRSPTARDLIEMSGTKWVSAELPMWFKTTSSGSHYGASFPGEMERNGEVISVEVFFYPYDIIDSFAKRDKRVAVKIPEQFRTGGLTEYVFHGTYEFSKDALIVTVTPVTGKQRSVYALDKGEYETLTFYCEDIDTTEKETDDMSKNGR
jgi:hypothetical protein